MRRSTLERTYTALETALNSLQSQGNWLAGQISSLPTYSS
jgi:flagellar hook-associated protein 2